MSASLLLRRLFTLLVVVGSASSALAQDAPEVQATAEHKILHLEEGTWDAVIKSYGEGPGGPASESKGVEVNSIVKGGLWVVSKFEGKVGPLSFEGRGQFGYDETKKKYIGTWIDSMSPLITMLEGTYDAKTKTLTFTGESVDPMSKAKYKQKMTTTMNSDGTRTFVLMMSGDMTGGKEMKMMEILYTKRK